MRKLIPLLKLLLDMVNSEQDYYLIEEQLYYNLDGFIDEIHFNGMCNSLRKLKQNNIITQEEYNFVYKYLMNNEPMSQDKVTVYWWLPVTKAKRIEWLEGQIELPNY